MNLDRFYETFIARDLFAKVVPGGILLLTVVWWLNGGDLIMDEEIQQIKNIPAWGWLFVYGVCYVLGFAVQGLGELVKIPIQLGNILSFQLLSAHPRDETYETFLGRLVEFGRMDFDRDRRSGRERLVVIKEMAGNVSLSSSLSFLIWMIVYGCKVFSKLKLFIFVVIAVVAILSLYWTYIILRWRQRETEEKMMNPAYQIRRHPILG